MEDLGLAHEPENPGADHDAGQQLAEDRGLAEPLHQLAADLRGQQDDDQPNQQLPKFHQRISATITGPQAVSKMLPSAYGTV